MNTLIKGLKEIVSLYKYCEMNGLLYKDDTMSINKEDSDPEFDLEIDKSRLNDIFVELLLCKLSYQVKAFNNVAWIPELNEAYIELGHYETIHVSFELDDRLCFGTHDTINILYCVTLSLPYNVQEPTSILTLFFYADMLVQGLISSIEKINFDCNPFSPHLIITLHRLTKRQTNERFCSYRLRDSQL